MRTLLLTVTLVGVTLTAAPMAEAQTERLQWNGDVLRWDGPVAEGRAFRLQGVDGSLRVGASEDGRVHLEARQSGSANVRLDFVEDGRGVSICVETCDPDSRGSRRWRSDRRVDFVARVPAGVHFNGSMIDGGIEVDGLRSDINVATINGDVLIRKSSGFAARATTIDGDVEFELMDGENADFHANTISGTIESDFPVVLGRSSERPPSRAGRFFSGGPPGVPGVPPGILRATLGNGGPELRATTISGDIRLRRR
jgi:hypothetical protein